MIISKKAKKIAIIFLLIITITICSKFISLKSIQKISLKSEKTVTLAQQINNISYVESSDKKQVPVPKGYTASKIKEETSVNGGFVIYEGDVDWSNIELLTQNTTNALAENIESTENKQLEKEKLQIQSKYNQYVWVPIDEQEVKNIYGIDNNGKLWGKLYEYNIEGRTPKDWTEKNGKISVTTLNKYFEPGLGYGANAEVIDEITVDLKLHMNREELTRELEQSYYETIKSIKKYGGFYIGRYETGILENEAVIRRMNENLTEQNWAQMYQKTKKIKGEKDNVKTSMIWNTLWDYTIEWLVNTESKSYETICSSDSWGNYMNSSFSYYTDIEANMDKKEKGSSKSKVIPSGSADYTKANNIYDMAGNVNELTLGGYSHYFVFRGGCYSSLSEKEKSCAYRSYQNINNESEKEKTGSRAILLLK